MKRKGTEDLTPEAIQVLLHEIEGRLPEESYRKIAEWLEWLLQLLTVLQRKELTIRKLRQIVFGAKTEKTQGVIPASSPSTSEEKKTVRPKTKKPGHGRRGTDAFPGATVCLVPLTDYTAGQDCPACWKGTLYPMKPTRLLRFKGQAPIAVCAYHQEQLRCGLCGQIYTAPLPPDAGTQKYAPSAVAMIAVFKYGLGLPWYRLGQLQSALQIPLAPSTQWQLLHTRGDAPQAVYQAFIHCAAQAPLLHNDDTTMRILKLQRKDGDTRTGTFTSGILACHPEGQIALYFTGTHHAGENLATILANRQAGLAPPLQMCDALDRNLPPGFATILGNCLTHGRRKFVDIVDDFPEECRFVIMTLGEVYGVDDHCRTEHFTACERLAYHQTHSQPKMEALDQWMQTQLREKRVEPNSGLGKAIAYMRNHWTALTLFLREPGAPLDNNAVERILKRVILHRKNALFYRTTAGAMLGDIYMSLIHTCQLNRINPFDYLTTLLNNTTEVIAHPSAWLPWTYKQPLAKAA